MDEKKELGKLLEIKKKKTSNEQRTYVFALDYRGDGQLW